MTLSTYKILISGRVQGVGFRPFVSRLAKRIGITGSVSNNEQGVVIFASGRSIDVVTFYEELIRNPPAISRIIGHEFLEVQARIYTSFDIVPSSSNAKLNLALTPDFGICDSCSQEISDAQNRRFHYPFTTCVDCGPRWSITETFPFEREHTTMVDFKMCPTCTSEYEDQNNRRYHSQTNSCPTCGIQLELEDNQGYFISDQASEVFPLLQTFIQKGTIIAIKNTGGYLLCCDASNPKVIQRLRRLKKRPKKPLAILYPSLERLQHDVGLNEAEQNEVTSPERPIVIVSSATVKGALAVDDLAPGLRQLGVMLPNSGILELLSKFLDRPIVATSGNIHGSPVISDKKEAMDLIAGVADYFLHHNLSISNAQDDSVVKFSYKYGQRVMFRRSRGYAPNYLDTACKFDDQPIAFGGHLKSTVAFAPNDYLYISQYLGNLDHFDVYNRFTEMITDFRAVFKTDPDQLLIDKHPAYLSSIYGEELSKETGIPLFRIQHHKAHFASVLGEHQLFSSNQKVLGVIWDGTGFGDDGQIWGGEFFSYESGEIRRTAFFEYFGWLAGDKMSKEPRLSLFSLNKDSEAQFLKEKFSKDELKTYSVVKKSNALQTSSVGRLFDAVASLLNYCDLNSYEGEGAILLENSVTDYRLSDLKLYVKPGKNLIVSTSELWENLYQDYCRGEQKQIIILNFLFTLSNLILEMAELTGSSKVAMSGGVFQNTVLVDMIRELSENKIELYFNRNLSPNDENISYGQFMYYMHCHKNRGLRKDV